MMAIADKAINFWNEKLAIVWNEWEIRTLVLGSLLLQVILIIFGSWRKRTANIWLRFLVWSVYLYADWVATVALGVLAKSSTTTTSSGKTSTPITNDLVQAFWAPFLLLHLGGPDTITAYSLEDNELWPRHLVGLFVEAGVAFYIFVRSWGNNGLNYIAIPMFISGIIKYGERTWVLRSSSNKHFRNSLLSDPDPGPDYAEYARLKITDKDLVALQFMESQSEDVKIRRNDHLSQAKYLFERLKYLFAELILGYNDGMDCHSLISSMSSKEAFAMVEVELGFLYDILYTKARIIYSTYGLLLRCISFMSSASALVAFWVIIRKPGYNSSSSADTSITYLLLIGALVLEVYALIILLRSDWTKLLFGKYFCFGPERSVKRWSETIGQYNLIRFCLQTKEEISIFTKVQKFFSIHEILEKHQNVTWENVDEELKELIFRQLVEKSVSLIKEGSYNAKLCQKLLTYRGDNVLEKMECLELLKWSTVEVEFDHSLLLWHIATELCYYDDITRPPPKRDDDDKQKPKDDNQISEDQTKRNIHDDHKKKGEDSNLESRKTRIDNLSSISRRLSNYMLYLLVICPDLLPKGISELRYRDTCAEAIRFFKRKKSGELESKPEVSDKSTKGEVDTPSLEEIKEDRTKSLLFHGCGLAKQLQSSCEAIRFFKEKKSGKLESMSEVCEELMNVEVDKTSVEEIKGDRTKSLLFHGCCLAKELQSLCEGKPDPWSREKKWDMMNKVWAEMFSYTAIHCGWKEHAQQLRRGGELLSHVCLLMAHLGLSDQYQIQKQYLHRPSKRRPNPRLFEELLHKVSRHSSSQRSLHFVLRIPPGN